VVFDKFRPKSRWQVGSSSMDLENNVQLLVGIGRRSMILDNAWLQLGAAVWFRIGFVADRVFFYHVWLQIGSSSMDLDNVWLLVGFSSMALDKLCL
jgi:hypothetical protein